MLRRLLKEIPRVVDSVRVRGAPLLTRRRGSRMPDGAPLGVDRIMEAYGVDRPRAEEISRRQTR